MNAVQTICATALALGLVGVVTMLAWHGTLDGQAVIGFLSGVTLAGAAGFAHNSGVRAGQTAAAVAVRAQMLPGALVEPEAVTRTGRKSS